jgi:predicted TIM-barrel fold metal-dependent hydrolase
MSYQQLGEVDMAVVVDGHCHLGIGHEYSQTEDELFREMDYYQVDKAVICPVDRCIAVDNREGNDYVLDAARRHPDRLFAFATANPWYGERAVVELRRALDAGARGIKLNPALQGFLLCDELVNPIVELAQARNVPVFFHTGTPAFAQPSQLSELAMRFPNVKFIMGHMGSTDFKMEAVNAGAVSNNIYLDCSWIMPDLVMRAVETVGAERVLFSSDSPLSTLRIEMGARRATPLSDSDRDKVMGSNMLKLLGEAQ